MKKEMTYQSAYDELEKLVDEMDAGDISIDALGLKVKRAVELISYCRTALRSLENETGDLLKGINNIN